MTLVGALRLVAGRRGTLIAAVFCITPCALPVPALAQLGPYTPTGSHVARAPDKISPKKMRIIGKELTRCVFGESRRQALEFLEHSDAGVVDFKAMGIKPEKLDDDLGLDDCLGESMTADEAKMGIMFPPLWLRGWLTEAAYLATNHKPLSIPSGGQERVDRAFVSTGDALRQARSIADFADCITFHGSAQADALLRTVPGDPKEMEAVQKLVPALQQCVLAGQKLELTPASIRTVVADGLWARSHYGTKVVTASASAAASRNVKN